MSLPNWLLSNYLKRSKVTQRQGGFTLIELLVGLILASLVITPLLGFMINVMDSDRKEQAKATSEQELKVALDFIKRDLEQAVYIYDANGIALIKRQLPKYDQTTNYFPVLVFWKRQYIHNAISTGTVNENDDTFVYALVAYYLIKGDDPRNTWSKAARIGRFQISDGYGTTDAEITSTRDTGFQLFDLSETGTLQEKMNKWRKSTDATQQVLPLVDYIDQTTGITPPNCPTNMQQIPGATGDSVPDNNLKTGSFYVCVNSSPTITAAEVHLRGNALARILNDDNKIQYTQDNKTFFPQASVQVKGRGFLFTQ